MQVVGRGSAATRAVIEGEKLFAQSFGDVEQRAEMRFDDLRYVLAVRDDQVLRQDGKRIAQERVIIAIR